MDSVLKYWNTHTKLAAAVLGFVAVSFALLWLFVLRTPATHMGYRQQAPQTFELHAGETRALTPFSGRIQVALESQSPLVVGYLPKQLADTMTDPAFVVAHKNDMKCARTGVTDATFECELPPGNWTLVISDARTVRTTLPTMYGNREGFSAASVPNRVRLRVAEYVCLDCTTAVALE